MNYREIKPAYTKDDEQIYVYTNSDGVYVGDNESKTLTNKLNEIDGEINKGLQKIEENSAQLSESVQQIETVKTEYSKKTDLQSTNTELATQKARIDSFTKLNEGSTTGDAELIDLRVAVDGITYENVGSAVRTQIGKLNNNLDYLDDSLKTNVKLFKNFSIGYCYQATIREDIQRGIFNKTLIKAPFTVSNSAEGMTAWYCIKFDLEGRYISQLKVINGTYKVTDVGLYRIFGVMYDTSGNSDISDSNIETIKNSLIVKIGALIPQLEDLNKTVNVLNKKYTVAKDGTGLYATIQEAIDKANEGDIITVKCGEYEEAIVNTRQITVRGENKDTTVIYNTTGEYATPPLWTCQGVWEGLTLYAKRDSSKDYSHLTRPGFAFHLDMKWKDNPIKKITVRDCIIKGEFSDAIGCGNQGNDIIRIEDCYLYSDGGTGFKLHSSDGGNGKQSEVYIKNNVMNCTDNTECYGFKIHTAGANDNNVNHLNIYANNNSIKNYVCYTTQITVDNMSYGNNITALNKLSNS